MNSPAGTFKKSITLLLVFYIAGFSVFYFLQTAFGSSALFDGARFLNWDAMHYDTIRREMYSTGMVAFFPLFPLLWKLVPVSAALIGLLNGLIYIVSLAWISDMYQIPPRRLLLMASVPSLIFMFLPYSEALFFLSGTILVAGLKKEKDLLVYAGIFLAGITRPVATVFMPAFLVLFWITENHTMNLLRRYLRYGLVCLVVFFAVLIWQYVQTGNLFAFFEVQKNWGNYFRWPELPLNSWAGGFIVRLDAIAFFAGIFALYYLILLAAKKLRNNPGPAQNRSLVFSLCYLAFMTVIIVATRGGVVNSLNRYLLCTVFFILGLNHFLVSKPFQKSQALLLTLLSTLLWLAFGSYVHIQTFLKFELLTLYLLMLFASTAENRIVKNTGYYSSLAVNVLFMMIFLHRFLNGEWVG